MSQQPRALLAAICWLDAALGAPHSTSRSTLRYATQSYIWGAADSNRGERRAQRAGQTERPQRVRGMSFVYKMVRRKGGLNCQGEAYGGGSGRELADSYDISNLGGERVESQDSVHLQLTPKASEVLKQLSRVDLWISLKTNCPVQQKFYMPGGDYRLVTYSDVRVNPPHLPTSALELPKGAKRERMN